MRLKPRDILVNDKLRGVEHVSLCITTGGGDFFQYKVAAGILNNPVVVFAIHGVSSLVSIRHSELESSFAIFRTCP